MSGPKALLLPKMRFYSKDQWIIVTVLESIVQFQAVEEENEADKHLNNDCS